jgi:hypothetical protein
MFPDSAILSQMSSGTDSSADSTRQLGLGSDLSHLKSCTLSK